MAESQGCNDDGDDDDDDGHGDDGNGNNRMAWKYGLYPSNPTWENSYPAPNSSNFQLSSGVALTQLKNQG